MTMALRRAVNRVNLLRRRPSPQHLVAITYALTYRCNSRCRHCHTWQDEANRRPADHPELTAADLTRIWTDNARYLTQLQSLHLTGGEPCLRPDLPDIINDALRRFPATRVSVSTNGLTGDRIVAALSPVRDLARVYVTCSLDGPRDVYAQIRGVDRYDEVLEVVRRLRRTFPRLGLGLNMTMMPDNAGHLDEMRALAAREGVDFGFQVAHVSAFYHNTGQDVAPSSAVLSDVARVSSAMVRDYRRVHGLLKSLVDVEPYYLAHMADRAQATGPRPASQPCHSGTHSLFLDPYGFVFPCIMLSTPLGRLPQQTLDAFWTAPDACSARRAINKGACRCWTSCEAFPSLSREWRVLSWNLGRWWRM